MTYRRARSLDRLLYEVNTRFPNRSKASDGWIGDAAHATRDSDHNPWVKDGTVGVVTAVDITDDSAPNVPEIADFIVKTLVRRRDPRVKYIIHESTMWRSYPKPGIPAWSPAPYSGSNSHTKHVHISVQPDKALYDSTKSWGLLGILTRGRNVDAAIARIKAAIRANPNRPRRLEKLRAALRSLRSIAARRK